MLTPSPPEVLAALAACLGNQPESLPATARNAAEIHQNLRRGVISVEDFGRYCRTTLPGLLRRLLDAESDLATIRTAVARHAAHDNAGLDPVPGDLLDTLRRVGISLQPDIDTAAALLDAEIRAGALG